MTIPDYGAVGFHWTRRGRGWYWFVNLYIWRRGPWRVSWSWNGHGGDVETPMLNNVFSRALADVLFGLKRKGIIP